MKKLTKPQERVIGKLSRTEWKSAYQIQESRGILNSLVRLGVAESVQGLGSLFSPRTAIKYKLKK